LRDAAAVTGCGGDKPYLPIHRGKQILLQPSQIGVIADHSLHGQPQTPAVAVNR